MNHDAIIIGAGISGLYQLYRLRELGLKALYFKLESMNPTGSFKDRGMVLAIAKAAEDGARAVICASTGNTSASAAAYAVRHGLKAYVIVPDGKIAMGKLAQAIVHGAEIVQIAGSFDDALNAVRELATRHPVALVNSVNPHRIEGQKTGAFEIVDDLGDAPGQGTRFRVTLPVSSSTCTRKCSRSEMLEGFRERSMVVTHPSAPAMAMRAPMVRMEVSAKLEMRGRSEAIFPRNPHPANAARPCPRSAA